MPKRDKNEVIEKVSEGRRDFVRKAMKAGFIVPVVATFTMTGLMATPAAAQNSNQS